MKHDELFSPYSYQRYWLFGGRRGLDLRLTGEAVRAVADLDRCVVAVIAVREDEDLLANAAFELADATARVGLPEDETMGLRVLLLDLGSAGGAWLAPVRAGALFYGGLTRYLKDLREVLAGSRSRNHHNDAPELDELPAVAVYAVPWSGRYHGPVLLAAHPGEPTRRMPEAVTGEEMDYLYDSVNAHYDAVVVAVNLKRLHHNRRAIAACRPWLEEADAFYLAGSGMVAAYDVVAPELPPAVLAPDDEAPLVLGLRLDRGLEGSSTDVAADLWARALHRRFPVEDHPTSGAVARSATIRSGATPVGDSALGDAAADFRAGYPDLDPFRRSPEEEEDGR